VFVSHTPDDRRAAEQIAEALRRAGLAVVLDEWLSPTRGAHAWTSDAQCMLYVPLISGHAVERAARTRSASWDSELQLIRSLLPPGVPTLPVVLDDTSPSMSGLPGIPGELRAIQWERLSLGYVPPEFTARAVELVWQQVDSLSAAAARRSAPDEDDGRAPSRPRWCRASRRRRGRRC
jgi:hypothetical protein